MRSFLSGILLAFIGLLPLQGQSFEDHFTGSTLRLDYVFCGDVHSQAIYFSRAYRTGAWAGRRQHLDQPALQGNGQVRVLDPESGNTLYVNSFSTLFQEWQATEEAAHVQKAFENCLQVPFPKHPVDIEVVLFDTHAKVSSSLKHRIDPEDILIRASADNGLQLAPVLENGSLEETIDIVVVSEGYALKEREKFFHDARRAADALFSHEPFKSHKKRFNLRAVFAPSTDSGVSIPGEGIWKETAVSSHFDTFYSDRYLTTSSLWTLYDLIGTVPFEHVIVLANTAKYGGGGIYNSVTIMNSDHPTFVPVLVHEFGHAFGGLGDEYAYGDNPETMYPADTEPWEPNLTTLVDFESKWADLVPEGTPVPTPLDKLEEQDVRKIWNSLSADEKATLNSQVGVFEGGGYQMKGVYRPVQECRMRINECEEFCPVCYRSIVRMIDYYTGQ
jgi:hypothetical protein